MKRYHTLGIVLLWLIIICRISLNAQQLNIDSLIHITKTGVDDTNKVIAFRALCGATSNSNPQQSIDFGWRGVGLSKKLSWDKGTAGCLLNLSIAYSNLGKYDSSVLILDTALVYAKKVGEEKRISLIYINMASAYIYMGKLDNAMQVALNAVPYAEKSGDLDRQARVNMTIGNIYFYQEKWKNAENYYAKSIPLFEQLANENMVGVVTMNMSISQKNRNSLDTAEIYAYKSIEILERKNDIENLILAHTNLGDLLSYKKNYTGAEEQYQLSIKMAEQIGDYEQQVANKQSLGDLYFQMKKYPQAEKLLLPIYDSALVHGFYDEQFDIAGTLSALYAETGNYEKAFLFLQQLNVAKDTIDNRKQNEQLQALQEQYIASQREKEIALLNATNNLQQKEIERKNLITILLVVIFGALVVSGFVIWNRYTLKQQLKEVQLRNKIAADLHDDVGATLSSIKMYSEIIKSKGKDLQTEQDHLLNKIINNSSESIESMSDIVWMVKPGNDKFSSLNNRIKHFAEEICSSNNIALNTNFQPELAQLTLPMDMRRDVYLLIKEAVNNAAKYAHATQIDIVITINNDTLQITVSDNGKGFDTSANVQGNGLSNMQARAAKYGGNCTIDSRSGMGTSVYVQMPVK